MKMTDIKLLVFGLLIILLTACSALPTSVTALPSQTSASSSSTITLQDKLGIGIIKLEDTTHALTAEQASDLLPLWKAIKSLSDDSTTASAEMIALYDQVQEGLTSEQVAEIDQLVVDQTVMSEMVQQYGTQTAKTDGEDTSSSSSQGGGMMPPDGGGAPMGGGEGAMMAGVQTSGSQTTQSGQTGTVSISSINVTLADSIIKILQAKIAAA